MTAIIGRDEERARLERLVATTRAGDGSEQAVETLTDLTPRQRQIVLLAARGLTNREIGEQLFLSPRTVGFHLYQVFPRLGITSRTQLRDVVERTHVTAARPVT